MKIIGVAAGPTAQAKAFLDRPVMFRRNGWMLRNKVGGAAAGEFGLTTAQGVGRRVAEIALRLRGV